MALLRKWKLGISSQREPKSVCTCREPIFFSFQTSCRYHKVKPKCYKQPIQNLFRSEIQAACCVNQIRILLIYMGLKSVNLQTIHMQVSHLKRTTGGRAAFSLVFQSATSAQKGGNTRDDWSCRFLY